MKFAQASTNDDRSALKSDASEIAEALGVDPNHKGTAKLAADLGLAEGNIDQMIGRMAEKIRAEWGEDCGLSISRSAICYTSKGTLEIKWRVWFFPDVEPRVSGSSMGDTLEDAYAKAKADYSKDRRAKQIAERIKREVEQAERLEQVVGHRDDGDATKGTLPLTSTGPSGIGGQYQREVMP